VNSMARPRSYHQDRALTGAERARAFRERRSLRNETSPHPQRNETPDRNETRVTKPRNETRVTKPRETDPRETGRRQTVVVPQLNAVASLSQVPRKSIPRCPPGDAIVHDVLARLKASGESPRDDAATLQILRTLYPKKKMRDAARLAYKRALPHVLKIIRWASLTRQWAAPKWGATPEVALEFVYGFLTEAGEFRMPVVAKIYDFLDKQPWSTDSRKFRRLQEHRAEMAADPTYVPTLALWSKRKTDEIIEAVLKLMRTNPKRPWASCELAERLALPRHVMRYVTKVMCNRTPPQLRRLAQRGPFALPDTNIQTRKPGTWRALQMLFEKRVQGVTFTEFQIVIGPTPSALRTLRRHGLATPADPKRKARIWPTPKAVALMERGEPIRNKSNVILWAPEHAGGEA
jgi:hypothetical protein